MELLNERTRRDLEFDKVLALLEGFAVSALGRAHLARLKPQTARAGIEAEFRRVAECAQAIRAQGFTLDRAEDLTEVLAQAQEATTVAPEAFLPVLETLEAIRRLKERLEALEGCDALRALARELHVFPELEGFIRRSVDEEGKIRDDASPALRALMSRRRTAEERARKKLNALLQSAGARGLIQEPVITRRSSRLVIPIKSHMRHQVDGIVQDSSNSGQTLYVEPASIVAENNLMRELEGEIRDEKLRILKELTAKLKAESRAIRRTLEAYAWLDSLYARARYMIQADAHIPRLNEAGRVRLVEARHPLLDPRSVVPISLSFGGGPSEEDSPQGMVITGPNTGGKTVTLKTTGLLTLMALSGIPVPAAPETDLSLFRAVRSDIGDEQSIEQNLSTFASHLRNLVEILSEVDERSLVLLDEVGAGTDPQEGAALGIAALRALLARGARVIATTHAGALKRYAYHHPRLKNASVEFDLATLSPTYRLLEGVPGASNAFVIARRLGLSEGIIADARRFLEGGEVKTEDLIQRLQQERAALDRERLAAERERRDAHRKARAYERRLAELEAEHQAQIGRDLRELEGQLRKARQAVEEALHAARAGRGEEEALRRELARLMGTAQTLERARQILAARQSRAVPSLEELEPGRAVRVAGFRKAGVIREIVHEGRIGVEIEGLKVWAKLADLRIAEDEDRTPATPKAHTPRVEVSPASPPLELNVRGLTVGEALRAVDHYLNQLLLAGRQRGYILHGKGSGALRRAIRDHLRTLPWVKGYASASPRQGGDGVTVVELA